VVDLIAKTPLADLLPAAAGGLTLTEAAPAAITSIMPFRGKDAACSTALKKAHNVELPAAGHVAGTDSARVVWTGRGQFFLIGDKPASTAVGKIAALTDQTHSWAVMRLEGDDAAAVLERLTPVDLRAGSFSQGQTARTELAHMMSVISKTAKGFEIMVMRSFARTAAHHVLEAMHSVTAQRQIN